MNNDQNSIIITLLILIVLISGFVFYGNRSLNDNRSFSDNLDEQINIVDDPIQIMVKSNEPIFKKGGFGVYPLAKYLISGKILAVKNNGSFQDVYQKGKSVYPMDVAIIWGEIANDNYDKYISYSHAPQANYSFMTSNQTLWVTVKPGGLYKDNYIFSHLSNNHVIPATEEVYNTLRKLKNGQQVRLLGYLVYTQWDDGTLLKKSSLSRTDRDCESFYVENVTVK